MAKSQSILTFDGQDDYVELPIASVPEGKEITVSFWAKGGSTQPKNNSIFYAGSVSRADARIINIHLPWGSTVYWDCGFPDGSAFNRIEKSPQAADLKGTWVHWAFTFDANTGKMTICRNGELWQTGSGQKRTIAKVGSVQIGKGYGAYSGSMSDVRVWRRALEPAEIKATMSTRLTGKEKDLVSYWPLDEGKGKKIIDQTGHGHDGTIKGGAKWETATDLTLAPASAQGSASSNDAQSPPSALKFANTKSPSDYVIVKPFAPSPTHAFTVEFWLKVNKNGRDAGVPFALSSPNRANEFVIFNCKKIEIYIHDSHHQRGSASFKKGQWQHCAATWESQTGQIHLYIDGQSLFDPVLAKGLALDETTAVVLGQDPDSYGGSFDVNQAFQGQMKEVRIWNYVRTPEEITAQMDKCCTGKEDGLVGYWPLDEGEGATVQDKTGNGNHGELHGVTWGTADDLALKPVPKPKRSTPASGALRFPKLSLPVHRPHFTQPALAVDVEHGRPEDLVSIRIDLLHGANYNDPAAFGTVSG
ncbi:MAG: cyanobactin biosynthesis system PatB/AcyB/McaB family protein [Spirulina sp. SIO3F2]|nr:cyanobactin biosynthesis system PatB/AcyB/McaB family protein [Spirulina sp. SIO3F2]